MNKEEKKRCNMYLYISFSKLNLRLHTLLGIYIMTKPTHHGQVQVAKRMCRGTYITGISIQGIYTEPPAVPPKPR